MLLYGGTTDSGPQTDLWAFHFGESCEVDFLYDLIQLVMLMIMTCFKKIIDRYASVFIENHLITLDPMENEQQCVYDLYFNSNYDF